MTDADTLVDKFSGFITKEQAERILNGDPGTNSELSKKKSRSPISVKELLSDMKAMGESSMQLQQAMHRKEQYIDLRDRIYRIFNPDITSANGRQTERRSVILGDEGSTIRLTLKGNACSLIDTNTLERGDFVLINNAAIDPLRAELKSGTSTIVNRIEPSTLPVISDFLHLREGQKKIDIVGRMIEIGSIRHVAMLGSKSQIAVASCTVTDGSTNVEASLWGSSALRTASIRPNDFVKMEFCDVRSRDGRLQICANDISRIVSGNYFASKMQKK